MGGKPPIIGTSFLDLLLSKIPGSKYLLPQKMLISNTEDGSALNTLFMNGCLYVDFWSMAS